MTIDFPPPRLHLLRFFAPDHPGSLGPRSIRLGPLLIDLLLLTISISISISNLCFRSSFSLSHSLSLPYLPYRSFSIILLISGIDSSSCHWRPWTCPGHSPVKHSPLNGRRYHPSVVSDDRARHSFSTLLRSSTSAVLSSSSTSPRCRPQCHLQCPSRCDPRCPSRPAVALPLPSSLALQSGWPQL